MIPILSAENKNTDGAMLRAKNDAWEELTRDYNASTQKLKLFLVFNAYQQLTASQL